MVPRNGMRAPGLRGYTTYLINDIDNRNKKPDTFCIDMRKPIGADAI